MRRGCSGLIPAMTQRIVPLIQLVALTVVFKLSAVRCGKYENCSLRIGFCSNIEVFHFSHDLFNIVVMMIGRKKWHETLCHYENDFFWIITPSEEKPYAHVLCVDQALQYITRLM